MIDLQGSSPTIQGGASIGLKAVNPINNIKAPSTTLPKKQVAAPQVQDLSGTYGLNNGTVYNKQTNKGLSLDEFKQATGLQSPDWKNLKFDTGYAPITAKPDDQPIAQPAVQPNPTPISATNPTPNKPYTPPNGGTTGVSQGGLIGNLINFAQNESPQVSKARGDLKSLEENYGKQTANISGSPIDLSLANGEQGILNRLYATKQSAGQTALNSALTSQAQQISATQGAGSLNAPIIASPGQVQVNPSQPSPGSTTSGAANLSSLIGTKPGPNGITAYFNKSDGQVFPTPQALADFVNQQMGGNVTDAQNVFKYIQQVGNGGGSNLLGLDQNTMNTYAQMLVSGQGASIPSTVTGNTALMAQLYQKAQAISGGNFNTNVAAGLGASQQANAQTGGTAPVNAANAAYSKAYQDYLDVGQSVDTIDQFGNLLMSNAGGVNPSDVRFANLSLSTIRQQLSSSQQAQFDSTLAALKSKVSGLLNVGGNETPTNLTSDANSIINGTVSLGALQSTLDRIKQEGQAIKNIAAGKANTALSQVQSQPNNPRSGVSVDSSGQGHNNIWSWN